MRRSRQARFNTLKNYNLVQCCVCVLAIVLVVLVRDIDLEASDPPIHPHHPLVAHPVVVVRLVVDRGWLVAWDIHLVFCRVSPSRLAAEALDS